MSVQLRTRKLKDGRESYYLDIYTPNGRVTEALKLYKIVPNSPIDRDLNKQMKRQAEMIAAKRLLEVQAKEHGLVSAQSKKLSFLAYFESQVEKRTNTDVDLSSWQSTLKHLRIFIGIEPIYIQDIDEGWLERFKEHLLHNAYKSNGEKISNNSAHHYFNRIKNCFRIAYRDKIIFDNPADRVDYIELKDTKREYLTLEEIQALERTECRYLVLKQAFLFSCLTGLRWADVQQLKWSEVRYSDQSGWHIYFEIKKTDRIEFLPISNEARSYLPEKAGDPEDRVFVGLKYSGHYNQEIQNWCYKAGIHKKITFHCARVSHASLLFASGVEIYMVQNILGHRHIKTTQLYTKIMDKNKIEAVNKIPSIKKQQR